jgi:hypothetical protein
LGFRCGAQRISCGMERRTERIAYDLKDKTAIGLDGCTQNLMVSRA